MAIKDYSQISDAAVVAELGARVRGLRLRKNLTQQQLAERALVSLSTIKALEVGKAKLATLVAVLRELGELGSLDQFLPDPGISPIELAKRKGKVRQRATGSRQPVEVGYPSQDEDITW